MVPARLKSGANFPGGSRDNLLDPYNSKGPTFDAEDGVFFIDLSGTALIISPSINQFNGRTYEPSPHECGTGAKV